ncbi:sulfite exporter TauE/SafE family protein [Spirilliplanes yamanashiensis]|uniref:Probable membrane transporter protein n=1 Tax=Spirilliplanes yamanashiensis TaxID=42233 RepID=A0A8J4DMH2_9ACTN|nr:sulfite exporter TauE/SafE family protein [Spirilliplanes yamanashiensis]MDP9816686.1 putative membrane protein YfcA [Spirilliplanes yamanashiensis]GIJ06209.1 UPF0721 transmembrane protein [Spirilliplanes yamanashiensis]
MDAAHIVLLVAAGFGAGVVNAVAGGGSLITFPTLLAVGLPPVAANVTNSVAVCPGYVSSVVGSRADLGRQRALLVRVVPTAVVGGVAGCVLLLATPARAFELVVPFLVLAAAGALAFQERLRALVGHGRVHGAAALQTIVFVGSVYGGYFGAALGVMLVAALALVLTETLNRVNALKNVLSAVVGVVTVLVFAVFGPVNWVAVAVLAPATVVGGYVGARVARRLPARVLRALIVTFGTTIGLLLLWRALT